MTALVQTNSIRKGSLEAVDGQDIGEEFNELIDLLRDIGAVQVVFYMQDAAAGRSYNVVEFRKILYKKVVAPGCKMLETGIGHGLPATGLIRWVDDFAAKLLEQFQGGYAYLGVKLVDVTGYE
jgi:hypothetical protein